MVRRCVDENNCNYPDYGAKGVKVFEDWAEKGVWGTRETPPGFLCFLEYVEENLGEKPDGFTLDRIDGKGNYEPGNIRWASLSQQNLNRNYSLMRGIREKPNGKFQVLIRANKTEHYLGTYVIIEDAIEARDELLARLKNG